MKLRKTSFLFPFVLASLSATHAATITRSATADNLNLAAAWGGAVPTTADIATWDASSTLSSVMGANNTWGGLDVSAASGAVAFTGANALTLDNATDANTIFHTGTNSFTWGATATAGNFHINGATGGTPLGSSASAGQHFRDREP